MLEYNRIFLFAERLLYSNSLIEKMAPPDLDGELPGIQSKQAFVTPASPGRPPELAFLDRPKRRSNHLFPSTKSLDNPRSRGHVLHFFANHELLAIELMSLAILKFRDAPPGFIQGIYETILEEQQHMHLYLGRMKELGVEFGEIPLNGFFWNTLRNMSSPIEYAAGMSLTFEQANIDFCLYYEQEFQRLGDSTTASILQTIRQDEIGHVKHGAIWMNRWKTQGRSLWEEYLDHLQFPMTPMRAKGPIFDRLGRLSAGLDTDYIDKLAVYSASKGRPPKVFWFNPSCEDDLNLSSGSRNSTKLINDLSADLCVLMAHLGHRDDILLVESEPSSDWILSMQDAGFEMPELLSESGLSSTLKLRKVNSLVPWGWSVASYKKYQRIKNRSINQIAEPLFWVDKDPRVNPYSKLFASGLRAEDDLAGRICASIEAVLECIESFRGDFLKVVIKSPYGCSGRNFTFFVFSEGLKPQNEKWILNQLALYGAVLVEPWVERVADFSYQFQVCDGGEFKSLGPTRFFVNERGQYKGHALKRILSGLPKDVQKEWHDPDHGWLRRFEATAHRVSESLFQFGYVGPAGIDGFVYRIDGEFRFQSLSEVNPRFTMGRVLLELSKHVVAGTLGVWIHLTLKELTQLGYASFSDFSDQAKNAGPLVLKKHSSSNVQIASGVLFTNDPKTARSTLTMLVVGAEYNDVARVLDSLKIGAFSKLATL
jgi:uncharacterized ferritin-like protein (DUF455 family)